MTKKNGLTGVTLVLLALLVFISVYAVIHHIKCVNFPYPLEYREGVVQYWVNCFVDEKPLYPKTGEEPPYVHNPYGPLYLIIAGIFQKLLPQKHTFFASRLLSFFSLLIACFFIFKIIKSRGACLMAGLLGAGFFLCSPISINYGSIEIVDILALSSGFAGLYAATKNTKTGYLFSGIFCAAAFLTKLVFILPCISIFIAIMLAKEKERGYFFAGLAIFLFLAFSILFLKYGANIITHFITLSSLPLSISHFFNVFSSTGPRHAFLFSFLAIFAGTMKDKRDPLYWYCLLVPVTFLFSAKVGSEANYFLEIIALSSVATGILFEKIGVSAKSIFLVACIAQMFLFLPFKSAPVFTKTYGQELPFATGSYPSHALKEAGEIIEGELMSVSDPVFSEDTGWLVVAGKEVIIEPYQFSQLARYGRWDEVHIVNMIKEKQFNLILMSVDSYEKGSEKFTPSMLEAIKTNYQIKRVIGNFYILEPRLWPEV
ncbi:MAG: hypothetical protein NC831_03370 [Candidatus Omnitrophica bacterium]|nr:hypothetical protein [Candidatus Omnitrophota bacterium]MCM8827829.1 hypothetical protein [Candidatus Omnitrophota bacterium]